jgi:hypothetical protein
MSRLFMPLLLELDGLEDRCCYKHVAPNGALGGNRRGESGRAEARPSVGNRIRSRNFRKLTRPRAMR